MPWELILLKLFCGVDFSAHQVVVCFTTPHDTESLSFHQYFGGASPRVVIRRFDESVCASRPYDQQITGSERPPADNSEPESLRIRKPGPTTSTISFAAAETLSLPLTRQVRGEQRA